MFDKGSYRIGGGVALGAIIVAALVIPATASAQCEEQWLTGPDQGIAGLDGDANAAVEWDPDGDGPAPPLLVVGGEFSIAGASFASNIAAWSPPDGTGGGGWRALGAGLNGPVHALTVFNGFLIAGGSFTATADGVPLQRLAHFDGVTWRPIGDGLDGSVSDFIAYNGQLVVGGSFQSSGGAPLPALAAWSGIDGDPLFPFAPPPDSSVSSFAIYNGDLIVGGAFTQVGSTSVGYIARWDGSSWHPIGSGVPPAPTAMTIYDGDLIVGGATGTIVRWDSAAWRPLGLGLRAPVVALIVHNGRLVAGAEWSHGGSEDRKLVIWNDGGETWDSLGNIPIWGVATLTEYSGDLIAGGSLYIIDGNAVAYVARYDEGESRWRALGPGASSSIDVFAEHEGRLIAGGSFTTIGDVQADRIVSYDPYGGWQPLGAGLNDNVAAITVYDRQIVAGGSFTESAGTPVNRVATWNGTAWEALGFGMDDRVEALAVYNGELIAGGHFTAAGGNPASHLAAWDGAAWRSIAPELTTTDPLGTVVFSLAVYEGTLYAGGSFMYMGDLLVRGIARWDGNGEWRRVTSGVSGAVNEHVHALHEHDGDLYVGGSFDIAGGYQSRAIALWDGEEWWPVGMGSTSIFTLATHDDALYAGGSFQYNFGPDVTNLRRIARYDPVQGWAEVGGGLDIRVNALHAYHGELFAGGAFRTAGDEVSSFLARWGPADSTLCPTDLNCDAAINAFDLLTYLENWFNHSPTAERTADVPAAINVFDLLAYLDEWFTGC